MKVYSLGIIALILNFATVLAVDLNDKYKHLEEIEQHCIDSRWIIESLTNHNKKVLWQFDYFAEALITGYVEKENFNKEDVFQIIEALVFAAHKHRFQVRKDIENTPYIIHPMGVAQQILTTGQVADRDIIITALLHDTVEDTNTTFEEITSLFGKQVAGYVQELTDNKALSKSQRKLEQLKHAPEKTYPAAVVKLSDKLYNLQDLKKSPPKNWTKERISQYFTWAEQVVDALPEANQPLKQAIKEVIAEYRKL